MRAAAAEFFGGEYSPAVTCAAGAILVLAIAVIDRLTGYDLHLGVIYLVPIAMVTWSAGRNLGIGLSVATVVLWTTIFRGVHHYSDSLYFYWDAISLLVTFLVVVLLIARLRAHEPSFAVLEKLSAPAYVVDLQGAAVLLGNREFRAAFAGRPAEELAGYPAQEARFSLADGRPALLRILSV